MPRFDSDRFFSISPRTCGALAFRVLQSLQANPERLVAGSAMLLLVACRHFGFSPARALDAASLMLRASEGPAGDPDGHYGAMRAYLAGEFTADGSPVGD